MSTAGNRRYAADEKRHALARVDAVAAVTTSGPATARDLRIVFSMWIDSGDHKWVSSVER